MESRSVIIIGAKGLGKVALDIFNQSGVVAYCFLDDDASLKGKEVEGVSVLGASDDGAILAFLGNDCNAYVASDDLKYAKNIVKTLKDNHETMPINALHPGATVSEMAVIGYGNLINVGAVINAGSTVGNHCLVHSNVLVDFESEVGDFVQIGAGTTISSGVKIEDEVFIGSGVTIVSGVKIGKGARIGVGSVVVEDVAKGATVFGNPATKVG